MNNTNIVCLPIPNKPPSTPPTMEQQQAIYNFNLSNTEVSHQVQIPRRKENH